MISIRIVAFFLFFPIISTLCHLPDQQPSLIAYGGTSSSPSQGQESSSNSALANCVFCSTCSLSSIKQFPYPGWMISTSGGGITPGTSGSGIGGGEECQDRSPKCVDFVALCADPLYQVYLRSHCSLSCGHCRRKSTGILPTPPPFPLVPMSKQHKRYGQRRQVLAPTKRKGIGENGGTTLANSTTTTTTMMMMMMTTTMMAISNKETTTKMPTGDYATNEVSSSIYGSNPYNETTTIPMPSSSTNGPSTAAEITATSTPSTAWEIGTATTGAIPSECEDIGQNCPALKANCEDIGQRYILGVFCRKTCGFC